MNRNKKKSQPDVDLIYRRADEHWRRGEFRKSFPLFLAVAESGHLPALYVVAQGYDFGEGVKKDEEKALYWYRRAYKHGSAQAATNIGATWRLRGKLSRALIWFHRAVNLGNDEANLEIARIYLQHKNDPQKALPYLQATRDGYYVCDETREEAERLLKKIKKAKQQSRTRR